MIPARSIFLFAVAALPLNVTHAAEIGPFVKSEHTTQYPAGTELIVRALGQRTYSAGLWTSTLRLHEELDSGYDSISRNGKTWLFENFISQANGADVNGDGKMDIVAVSAEGGWIRWIPTINTADPIDIAHARNAPAGVFFSDFNRDGRIDMLVAENDGSAVDHVSDVLGSAVTTALPIAPGGFLPRVLTDVDHDGCAEIVGTSTDGTQLHLLGNDCTETWNMELLHDAGSVISQVIDLKRDAQSPLFAMALADRVLVLDAEGNVLSNFPATSGSQLLAVSVGMVEGHEDLVVAGESIVLHELSTVNGFADKPAVLVDEWAGGILYAQDEHEVAFLTIQPDGMASSHRNLGLTIFRETEKTLLDVLTNAGIDYLVDIDADRNGTVDLVYHVMDGELGILFNNGPGSSPRWTPKPLSSSATPIAHRIADMDKDGAMETLLLTRGGEIVSCELPEGSCNVVLADTALTAFELGDLNSDGNTDFILGDDDGALRIVDASTGTEIADISAPTGTAVEDLRLVEERVDVHGELLVDYATLPRRLFMQDADGTWSEVSELPWELGALHDIAETDSGDAYQAWENFVRHNEGSALRDVYAYGNFHGHGDLHKALAVAREDGSVIIFPDSAGPYHRRIFRFASFDAPSFLKFADVDADGLDELVVADTTGLYLVDQGTARVGSISTDWEHNNNYTSDDPPGPHVFPDIEGVVIGNGKTALAGFVSFGTYSHAVSLRKLAFRATDANGNPLTGAQLNAVVKRIDLFGSYYEWSEDDVADASYSGFSVNSDGVFVLDIPEADWNGNNDGDLNFAVTVTLQDDASAAGPRYLELAIAEDHSWLFQPERPGHEVAFELGDYGIPLKVIVNDPPVVEASVDGNSFGQYFMYVDLTADEERTKVGEVRFTDPNGDKLTIGSGDGWDNGAYKENGDVIMLYPFLRSAIVRLTVHDGIHHDEIIVVIKNTHETRETAGGGGATGGLLVLLALLILYPGTRRMDGNP